MRVIFFSLVLSILVALVANVQIFPLKNPDPYTADKVYKMRYSGLTAGLLPGAKEPLELLEAAAGTNKESVAPLAKDLLPPKFGAAVRYN